MSARAKGRVWSIEVFGRKCDAAFRVNEITKHLDCTYKIVQRTVRADGERVDAFVLIVRVPA